MVGGVVEDPFPVFSRFFHGGEFCDFALQLDVGGQAHEEFPGELDEDGRLVAEQVEEGFEVLLRICEDKLRVLCGIVIFIYN